MRPAYRVGDGTHTGAVMSMTSGIMIGGRCEPVPAPAASRRPAAVSARLSLAALVLVGLLAGQAWTQGSLPADLGKLTDELTQKFAALNDDQRRAVRADAKLTKSVNELILTLDGVRDENDNARTLRAVDRLAELIAKGRFTAQERRELAANEKIKNLEAELNKLLRRVRVMSATYGDHKTGRTCNATAYFKGRCDGQTKCPPETEPIAGSRLCSFEPAPLAEEGASAAKVNYLCGDSPQPVIELRGNGQIVCNSDSP